VTFLPFLISITSCTGTSAWRISFVSAGRGSSSIRLWRSPRTLFSCPAVVWIAYQRYSIYLLARETRDSCDENQLEQPSQQADREPQYGGEHDNHSGGLDQLRPG